MATLVFTHSIIGAACLEFEVSDANWRISKVRCINSGSEPAYARILLNGSQVFEATCPAGQTASWNTSGIQIGWDSVDGGIMMNGYVIQARYPA